MLRQMLRSKVHRATVTDAQLDYEGSLALDPVLLEKADLLPGEKVLIANIDNGARFETYLIRGSEGEVCLNGAAARLGAAGDKIIVMAFGLMDDAEARKHTPIVVKVDADNRPLA